MTGLGQFESIGNFTRDAGRGKFVWRSHVAPSCVDAGKMGITHE